MSKGLASGIRMREGLAWMGRNHKDPQELRMLFQPSEPTNPHLIAVLERYATAEGFINTLVRVLIEEQHRTTASKTKED